MGETPGQRHLAHLGPAGQLSGKERAAAGVLGELDHVLVDLQAADLSDLLNHHAIELKPEGVADRGVNVRQGHTDRPPVQRCRAA
jgi:hypothetical protein